jgi:OOP family OmpA-OmpF porin
MRDRVFLALAWAAFFLLCWASLVRNESPVDRLPQAALRVSWGDGPLRLDGEMPDEVTKARLALEIERLDPRATVVDLITVGSQDLTGGWLPTVTEVLKSVSGRVGRGQLHFTSNTVTIAGQVPTAAARTAVISAARAAAGSVLGVSDQLTVTASAPVSSAPRTAAEVQSDLRRLLAGRTIDFESAGSVLTGAGRSLLDELVALLKSTPDLTLEIHGHTDASGAPDENLGLSEARAQAVRTYLVSRGLPADRLTAHGHGANSPLADNSTPAGRKQNRRIDFRVGRP